MLARINTPYFDILKFPSHCQLSYLCIMKPENHDVEHGKTQKPNLFLSKMEECKTLKLNKTTDTMQFIPSNTSYTFKIEEESLLSLEAFTS